MDQGDLKPLLEDLSGDIDALTRSLKPLLDTPLPSIASKLPLLDKAKLHVLTTYAIESLLFSSLRLSGVDAKEHPVFRELARTRQYFEKIKKAEDATQKRTVEVDKAAAGRFIKAGLAGNEGIDRQRAGEHGRQQAAAKRKLEALDKRSEQAPEVGRAAMLAKRGKWMTTGGGVDFGDASESLSDAPVPVQHQASVDVDGEASGKKSHKSSKRSKRHRQKSDKAPKSGHEAFQSLMGGPSQHG